MNHVRCAALLLLAGLLVPAAARAQVRITGAISGIVTDPSDALIPGATVQLKDEGTGLTRAAGTCTGRTPADGPTGRSPTIRSSSIRSIARGGSRPRA